MTAATDSSRENRPGLLHGLSGKVLLLTILFVMLGEILIFLPSIANFRLTWLKNRVAQAEIAALAVEAAPDRMLSGDLRNELLMGAGVHVVALRKGDTRQLVLRGDNGADDRCELRSARGRLARVRSGMPSGRWRPATARVIGVIDTPPNMSGDLIEVALDEAPLRAAMLRYAFNILIISVILSLMVAGLVFLALNRALVRPMQRLTANMVAFGDDPENPEPHHRARAAARRDRRRRARIARHAERAREPCCSRRTIWPPWASR